MTKASLYTCLGFACLCLAWAGSTPAHAQVPVDEAASQPPALPLLRPGGDDPQRYSLLGQTQVLRAQIEDLRIERSRYGIAAPIAMMAGGGGATVVALYIYALSELASNFDCDFDGECKDNSTLNSFLAVVGVGGVVTAVVGLVMLQNRLEPRRELGHQITAKRIQLKSLEDRLRFSAMLGPHDLRGASLSLTF